MDLSYHPFIKYNIFYVTVTFPPRGNYIGIVAQYCDHNNMYYIYYPKKNSPWNRAFTGRNETNAWILRILGKETRNIDKYLN